MENSPEFKDQPQDPQNESGIPEYLPPQKAEPKKILFGVCSKIAKRVSFPVWVVRGLFVFLAVVGGWGIAAYLLLAFMLPDNSSDKLSEEEKLYNFYLLTGISSIAAAVYFILEPTGLFDIMSFLGFRAMFFIPALIMLALFFAYFQYGKSRKRLPEKITRSVKERRIKGVCGGIARYTDSQPIIVRLMALFFIFLSGGLGLLVYFYLAFTTEEEGLTEDEN